MAGGKKDPNPIKDQRAAAFAQAFLGVSGGNATEAYMESHPDASRNSAQQVSHEYIRKPEVIKHLQLQVEIAKTKLVEAAPACIDVLSQMATKGTRPVEIGGKLVSIPIKSDDTQRHAAQNVIETVIGKTKDEGRAAPGKIEIGDVNIQINIATDMMRQHHLDMLADINKKDEGSDDVIDVGAVEDGKSG